MKSIVIIFPYFGTLPAQYPAWRASALRNPTVDFMFFTDADVEPATNIIVHRMTFDDFRQLAQQAFSFPIVLDRPYKLCEYKQAYGYMLHDYISRYDFWGFGDLDLVYGDLRRFLTDEVLARPFILGWGHLTLLHNDAQTNAYFMQQADGYQDYREAFTTKTITFFDEFNHRGCSDKWRDLRPEDCWLEEPFDNVSKPKQAFHFCSLNRGWQRVVFEHQGSRLFMLRFADGRLERRESLYAHFQHRPSMRMRFTDADHFLVTPTAAIDYPHRFATLRLRYYCRRRQLTTLLYQWRDRLLWKLGLSHFR
ncbi:MAG: hypothetical protein IJ612_05985 [Prevotella sp.]|nr:hypothetical protein [Prevotella sp.]